MECGSKWNSSWPASSWATSAVSPMRRFRRSLSSLMTVSSSWPWAFSRWVSESSVSAETLLSDTHLEKAQGQELLTVINEESDRLNRLIGETAEVAQLDAGQLEFHFEPHSIREAIDSAIQT